MVQNPIGILSFSELQLSNLDKHIKDFSVEKNVLRVEIEANGNYAYSENAQRVAQKAPGESKTGYCLWPSDGDADAFFKEGRAFYLKNDTDELNYYTWKMPAMFNTFTSKSTDEISISLVLETADVQQTSAKDRNEQSEKDCQKVGSQQQPEEEQTSKSKRQVIGRAKLPFAEISLIMSKQRCAEHSADKEKTKPNTLAVEMDFLSPNEAGLNITELMVPKLPDVLEEVSTNKKSLPESKSYYNLLSEKHSDKLILTMELDFNTEVVKEAKQFKTLKHTRN